MRISKLSPVALVLVLFCMAANATPNRGDERVIYDGDFIKYRQEHTAAWSQQDTDIKSASGRARETARQTAQYRPYPLGRQ